MFGLYGLRTEHLRLGWDRGFETIYHRDLVAFFKSEKEACDYAHSWSLKRREGFHARSVLKGYTSFEGEEHDVPHSPQSKGG